MENSNEKIVEEKTEEQTTEESTEETADESNESAEEQEVDDSGRKLYKVNCSECKKETKVPFEPDGERPVYCKTCLMAKRNAQR